MLSTSDKTSKYCTDAMFVIGDKYKKKFKEQGSLYLIVTDISTARQWDTFLWKRICGQ
jgi:hypothetical protein